MGDTSLELPKLAGVATALLELSARPVLDERGDYLLLAKASTSRRHSLPTTVVLKLVPRPSRRRSSWDFTSAAKHG